jgi:hypothetical protein
MKAYRSAGIFLMMLVAITSIPVHAVIPIPNNIYLTRGNGPNGNHWFIGIIDYTKPPLMSDILIETLHFYVWVLDSETPPVAVPFEVFPSSIKVHQDYIQVNFSSGALPNGAEQIQVTGYYMTASGPVYFEQFGDGWMWRKSGG